MERARERHEKGLGKSKGINSEKVESGTLKRAKTCEKLKFLPDFGSL